MKKKKTKKRQKLKKNIKKRHSKLKNRKKASKPKGKKKSKKRLKRPRKSAKKRVKKPSLKTPKINKIKKRLNINFLGFFKKIVAPIFDRIQSYQKKVEEERNRSQLAEQERQEKAVRTQLELRRELLKREIKEEEVLAKKRAIELKIFLKQEQKLIREREKEKQRKFIEEVKLEKTLEKFRERELNEIKAIEKYSLKIEKEDFKSFQSRIEQVKEKYKALRNERLRKRVEELGVTLSDKATIEEIRQKEKEYLKNRELIETSLESFVRSATSLIYQINKRYLPRNADLLRVINLVYEQSEIIIREDQEQNENFLMLIYVKDQDTKKDLIVVEDKTNPEKHKTREYSKNQIFKFGDDLTDSMIRYLEMLREKNRKAS